MVWWGSSLLLPTLFLASHVGASVDLTLLANLRITDPQRFFLTCVSGEAGAGRSSDPPLLLEKDDRIVRTFPPGQPLYLARNGSHQVTLRGFSKPSDLVGVFSCVGGAGARRTRVLYVHNSPGAHLFPDKVTHTVNKGDTAVLSAHVHKEKQTDVIWKNNGSYFNTLDWQEADDGRFQLQLQNVQPPSSGIYSATYLEASPLGSAFFRLIVRGFTGTRCEQACREGRFGQSCQEQCPGTAGCRGLTFCLPDPYGCSCGSGWRGSQCQEACAPGHFGADCRLQCQCQNGGTCDRFSGCVCPSGWHGVHCEKSDRIPQILSMATEVEFNIGTMPRINCAAAGNPFPVRGSMKLRKPDGTMLLSTKVIVEPDRTTAEFEVPSLTLGDSGFWECRVSTSGGQDSRRFKVNVKVPPVPLTAPRLLAKQSRQLVVSPLVSFSGDGPISSVRLHYRPQDSTIAWSAIVGPPAPRHLHAQALSDSEIQLMWQHPEAPSGPISKYIVEIQVAGGSGDPQWMDVDRPEETSIIVRGLNASTRYLFRVRASVQGLGDWSNTVEEATLGNGLQSEGPVRESRAAEEGLDQQLVLAVVGSVSATCLTILAALLALVCIRRSCLHRRRTFTYQSGSGEETILQFSSGTLTLTRRPKPQPEPLSYPVLEWEDITFEDLIGEGNFGQVIRAMIKKDGLKMNAAIKMLKEYASENDHRDFAGELEVLCKLGHHPNIINLLGACENRVHSQGPGCPKCAGRREPGLQDCRLWPFSRGGGVCEEDNGKCPSVSFRLLHSELTPRPAPQAPQKALSFIPALRPFPSQGRLPVRWMAIESLNYSVYTTKSDVWSFGVLLWEIVSLGGTPYCGMTCAELYEKLPQGYRMEQPRNCDDEVYELMRQCWRDRPYERPPFAQIALQLGRMLEARKAYVNMSLFENFTYAGIDATAEEA